MLYMPTFTSRGSCISTDLVVDRQELSVFKSDLNVADCFHSRSQSKSVVMFRLVKLLLFANISNPGYWPLCVWEREHQTRPNQAPGDTWKLISI